jgi:predicted acetyltransferase
MPSLELPTVHVRQSFLKAMEEFRAEGRGRPDDESMIGSELRDFGATWSTSEGFAAYVQFLLDQSLEETPRPAQYVPSTSLWWIEGDEYLGRLAIRHRLSAGLLESGGHIGYDVRPAARRKGHATTMLRTALPIARRLGIESALITTDATNVASRRVIEANGGVLADGPGEGTGTVRYWVPTA